MDLIVVYDVSTVEPAGRRRLRKVARICESFGIRVQNSVFEVSCTLTDLTRLKIALEGEIKKSEDNLRIYSLGANGFSDVWQIGLHKTFETDEAWTI